LSPSFPIHGLKQIANYGHGRRQSTGDQFLVFSLFSAVKSAVNKMMEFTMHYERAPLLEATGEETGGGFAPAPPGFNALMPLPIWGFRE
jgi:hypothetical protein